MKHGSLFSGIGGFDIAAEWVGWENVFQVEIDDFCTKVLEKHWPNVQRFRDIKEFNGKQWRGRVDIISGGFPCQPFSQAGKRKGQADDRYLWPEMLRVISEAKPSFVVGENVAGLISMENGKTLDRILSDLENEGYTTEQFIIPACGVGAWHRRDRIWIIANNVCDSNRLSTKRGMEMDGQLLERRKWDKKTNGFNYISKDVSNNDSEYSKELQRGDKLGDEIKKIPFGWSDKEYGWVGQSKSDMGGMVTGLSYGMDGYWDREPEGIPRVATGIKNRVNRLKSLGNAIVPQVVYEIFKAIDNL